MKYSFNTSYHNFNNDHNNPVVTYIHKTVLRKSFLLLKDYPFYFGSITFGVALGGPDSFVNCLPIRLSSWVHLFRIEVRVLFLLNLCMHCLISWSMCFFLLLLIGLYFIQLANGVWSHINYCKNLYETVVSVDTNMSKLLVHEGLY